ncbi:hypothetical protein AYI70_g1701 [Smittium culicis]|uniref:Uncharacterized protein n=1 Tax=Smittium culicis TaxID=133412 RepID=A0A1R1YC75_9FUNG|nr:hypothetical protein AYI70_g1701 [Smittium culicis]
MFTERWLNVENAQVDSAGYSSANSKTQQKSLQNFVGSYSNDLITDKNSHSYKHYKQSNVDNRCLSINFNENSQIISNRQINHEKDYYSLNDSDTDPNKPVIDTINHSSRIDSNSNANNILASHSYGSDHGKIDHSLSLECNRGENTTRNDITNADTSPETSKVSIRFILNPE